MKAHYPKELSKLIAYLKKLPGVGEKTAERFAFHFLNWNKKEIQSFGSLLGTLQEQIQNCNYCGCLVDDLHCRFCLDKNRKQNTLCIIATPRDVYAIEETGFFNGMYHVLGMLLSPLEGKTPDQLNLPHLHKRIQNLKVEEVILALEPTLEGDATALFLKEELKRVNKKISRLALGLPIGSSLDFIDEGTLTQALAGRQEM